jgi:ABC-type transporter Mla MlaB component
MSTPPALPPALTIYSLVALKALSMEALPKPTKSRRRSSKAAAAWPMESSAVNEVDAAGIQWLVALSHSLQSRHLALQLANPSQPLIDACLSMGLSSLLANPGATE